MPGTSRRRDIVVVGESVGALIGLDLADGQVPQIKGVLAGQIPPLTTAKQWAIFTNFLRRGGQSPAARRLSDVVHARGLRLHAGSHRRGPDLLQVRRCREDPGTDADGDVPLWPVRPQTTIPCLLDATDRWMLGTLKNPNITLHDDQGIRPSLPRQAHGAMQQPRSEYVQRSLSTTVQHARRHISTAPSIKHRRNGRDAGRRRLI